MTTAVFGGQQVSEMSVAIHASKGRHQPKLHRPHLVPARAFSSRTGHAARPCGGPTNSAAPELEHGGHFGKPVVSREPTTGNQPKTNQQTLAVNQLHPGTA